MAHFLSLSDPKNDNDDDGGGGGGGDDDDDDDDDDGAVLTAFQHMTGHTAPHVTHSNDSYV